MTYVVGVDIGGTCTDCVVMDDAGTVTLAKAFSTPPDFAGGIFDALDVAAEAFGTDRLSLLRDTRLFLHSTTVAENAVVDETLATAGVITTEGFEDTLFAMRGGYGRWSGLTEEEKRNPIETDKPAPIVARHLVRGVGERTDVRGRIHAGIDEQQVERIVAELREAGAEALGVSLLWSFANPENELKIRDVVRRVWPDGFLTLSHEIAPIVGEYERTSTVALNARLGPVVQKYLLTLRDRLRSEGFEGPLLVAQAYGGLLPLDKAAEVPVGMIESGPVSGVVGCQQLGEKIGSANIIAADIGGTTFKVGVVREGLIEYQRESMVLRYHYALPKMDVVSLGIAGGSIIAIDRRTGAPRIGPRSAGSYPGPVCYGHGGDQPTVTDVDAILGYLNPRYFLGGREALDIERAREVFQEQVAEPLGRPLVEAAAAMYRFANSLFYDLLHRTTVQRGLDPRRFDLYSFGGTAGMHVGAYGEQLGVNRIVIPHSASVHGAFGLIASDMTHEEQITQPMQAPPDLATVDEIFSGLHARVAGQLEEEGFGDDDVVIARSIDMRYRRQVHVLTVPVEGAGPFTEEVLEQTLARFERLYEEKYGKESAYREAGVELVSFRLRGSGLVKKPGLVPQELGDADASSAHVETVTAWVDAEQELREVNGYDFELMAPGHRVAGPAIVWSPITTLVIASGQHAEVDGYRNLIVSMAGRRAGRHAEAAAAAAGGHGA